MTKTESSDDKQIYEEMQREREEFLKTVDVKVLDNADGASSFSAIISSCGPIVIE